MLTSFLSFLQKYLIWKCVCTHVSYIYIYVCVYIYLYISDNSSNKVQECLSHQITPYQLFSGLRHVMATENKSPNICIMFHVTQIVPFCFLMVLCNLIQINCYIGIFSVLTYLCSIKLRKKLLQYCALYGFIDGVRKRNEAYYI